MERGAGFLRPQQQLSQRQTLSARQLQYLRLLQMNAVELNRYLDDLYMENPLTELEPPRSAEEPGPAELLSWVLSRPVARPEEETVDRDENPSPFGELSDESHHSLAAYLRSQFDLCLTDADVLLLEQLISLLDENGYLPYPLPALAQRCGVALEAVQEAAAYLQSLDPPGVAARDLTDCLLIQLSRIGIDDPAIEPLLKEHLADLSKGHFQKAARAVGITPDRARALYDIIRTLHPKPASAFGGGRPAYVLPDITVILDDGKHAAIYNRQHTGSVAVNQNYLRLANEDEQTKTYLDRKLTQLMWVMRALQSRRQTIERIVGVILERQRAFFTELHGPLVPLRLRDVAAELHIHESTVSRAISQKHLQCQRGVFPLRHFFSAALPAGEDGQAPGADAAKERLRALIAAENASAPLSDNTLAELLGAEGLPLARRTVAKYREELGIPSSSLRRIRR
jgi:RNA polymerase sigma-54 factor